MSCGYVFLQITIHYESRYILQNLALITNYNDGIDHERTNGIH